jgi:hypothetical protein
MTERIAETVDGYVVDEGPASQRTRAHQSWRHAETVKRLSDRLISIGPFGLGLDGVLAWVPGVGLAYSVGAGAVLLFHALQAKASPAGWAVDTQVPGHLMAAKALQKDIESRHGLPDEIDPKTRKKRRVKKARR